MLQIEVGQHIVDYVVSRVCGGIPIPASVGIGTSRNGIICGGVVFYSYNYANIWMHSASESKYWLSKEYLKYMFEHAFVTCGVKRITGFVDENNTHARKFNEHIGFELETKLKEASPSGDVLVYTMWKENCKWLV
jgi:RimJ/RimL family protein N-acetyltransferase